MAHKLKKLTLSKVALVPAGANPHAHITLYKSVGPVDEPSVVPGTEQATDDEVEKIGRVMSRARMQQLRAAIDALEQMLMEADGQKGAEMADEDTMTMKSLEERLASADAEVQRLKAALAKAEQSPKDQEAEFLKGLPEPVRKRWEQDAVEKAELRVALEVEKAKREQQEYIEKTAAYRDAGLAPDDWEVLKALDTLPEEPRARLEQLLKSAGAVARSSGLFRQLGTPHAGNAGDPAQQIETLAKEKVASGAATTYEIGYTTVLKEHPELYKALRDAEREGRSYGV
jgi:uncharacterized small protein (DUF1192 family)